MENSAHSIDNQKMLAVSYLTQISKNYNGQSMKEVLITGLLQLFSTGLAVLYFSRNGRSVKVVTDWAKLKSTHMGFISNPWLLIRFIK